MDFNSLEELKKRVEPALRLRSEELNKNGLNISCDDIWIYLSKNKWSKKKDLNLFNMVEDILNFNK